MSNGHDDTTPRPGTTASVERRVERIEEKVDAQDRVVSELAKELAVMKAEQGHLRELMQAEFKALTAGQGVLSAKMDGIDTKLSQSDVRAAQAMGDPMETPAGRAIMEVIKGIVGDVSTLKRQAYMIVGALTLLSAFLTIFGPSIRAAIHLP